MAQLASNTGREKGKKNKLKKALLRVDFTPMVDMNMLLITFFMFCTTFSKPQILDIVLPTKISGKTGTMTPASRTTTLFLGDNDKIYYFFGEPDYENPNFANELKTTDYTANGLRNMLLEKNADVVAQVRELSEKVYHKQITQEEFETEKEKIKKSDKDQTVIIKPSNKSAYKNLIDVLDELRICNISKYAVVDISAQEENLINKLPENNSLALN